MANHIAIQNNNNILKKDEPVSLNPHCFACCNKGLSDAPNGFTYKFSPIVVTGENNQTKQTLSTDLIGLNINLLMERSIEFTFHKGTEHVDYVKMGGFGGNTYKLKNLVKRLADENDSTNISGSEFSSPFQVDIYSKNVVREYTLIVLPENFKIRGKYLEGYISHIQSFVVNNKYYDNIIAINTNICISEESLYNKHRNTQYLEEIKMTDNEVAETYKFYSETVQPFAKRQSKERFFNLIAGKTDEEIIFQCADFIIVKDVLWKDTNINNMQYLAIFKNPALMSIRDLDKSSVLLLESVLKIGIREIGKLHDLSKITVETYFHYHPSVWLLHIHFVSSTIEEKHKKFMVSEIIGNLQHDNDYYKKNIVL